MVYGRYNYSFHGVYKPTCNWGGTILHTCLPGIPIHVYHDKANNSKEINDLCVDVFFFYHHVYSCLMVKTQLLIVVLLFFIYQQWGFNQPTQCGFIIN